MTSPILIGAVIYDPKVALIWDIIKDFFQQEGCPIDYVFYSNYELMTDALVGQHIHIAWNSPLAWIDAQRRTNNTCRALAMRDTDRDRVTHIVARKDSGLAKLADLKDRIVATGAIDSPQAHLLPLLHLRRAGLQPGRDFSVRRFDVMVGKHGDHVGGELEALKAVDAKTADASAILDLNWERYTTDGTVDPARYTVLATTPPFDHCNFTVVESFPESEAQRWTNTLYKMRYDNSAHREMMDMEGLKAWFPGRTTQYADLAEAAEAERFFSR
jgi:ABC-type phosphate/phosphonate transport system substrate-binding protein